MSGTPTESVAAEYGRTIRTLSDELVGIQRPIRILDAVKWDDSVREAFFAAGCRKEPAVDARYYARNPLAFDTSLARARLEDLDQRIESRLGAEDPAAKLMRRMCREYELVLRMLDARGTRDFYRHSASLYGRASDPFHAGGPSLVELASLLDQALRKLDETAFGAGEPPSYSAEQAVQLLQERLDRMFDDPAVRVLVRLDDGIVADAAAGSNYIKLRGDARFRERDLRVLEVHEGWVHAGTSLNGQAQPVCSFLGKGTPSTTVTQEGLALLVEVVSFSSHPRRLRRVTDRVRAIHRAEQGASFLEVFESLRAEGRSAEEAYPTCARVFRGSTPEAGPFGKDLSYSRGFVEVYNFIRLAVRRGRLDRLPLLFAGKLTLEDMGLLAELQARGVLAAPRYLPPQFADPSALAAWMAYSNFLNLLDLAVVESELAPLLD